MLVPMRADSIPELDTEAIAAASIDRMRAIDAEAAHALPSLLARLDPGRWTLEWSLPWWLGHAFGLDPEIAFELVVSDVLGLASIRVQDDLVDGEVTRDAVASTRALGAVLYVAALRPYQARFDANDPIWHRIDGWMDEWRGVIDDGPLDLSSGTLADPAVRRLAGRAAPLRIPAYGVCALTGHLDDFGTLDRCLDHALAALVLYDHLIDREDDLDALRWNAVVAAASALPQTRENRERNRVAVEVALLTGGAAEAVGRRIEEEFVVAARLSETIGCPPLTLFLQDSGARARRQAAEADAHYRDVADDAARLLFGDAWDGAGRTRPT